MASLVFTSPDLRDQNTTKPLHPKLPFITRLKLYILNKFHYIYQDGSINRRLFSLVDFKAPAPSTKRINPTTTVSTSDIVVDSSRNLWFRLFVPCFDNTSTTTSDEKPNLLPLIVYFHGGGFTDFGPDSKSFHDLCINLAGQTRAVIASVNYRLAPEHKYPAQYDDGFDVLKFIDQQDYAVLPSNTDLNKCFIAGDSAGGNIAHHVTVKYCERSNEFEKIKVVGLVAFQPFFGGEERTESELKFDLSYLLGVQRSDWMWRSFLPEGADRNHPAAHVFGGGTTEELIMKQLVEFPKSTLIVVGGYDPVQDWHTMYIEWLRDCGKEVEVVEYPDAFHAFYLFPELPETDLLISDVAKFIGKQARF